MNTMNDQANTAPIPAIGTPMQGGFFAGRINANGRQHGLIVAPKSIGDIESPWDKDRTDVPGSMSFFDGLANTEAMAEKGIACAVWARGLDIDGHKDWYIPARDELEVLYRNLKPTAKENACWSGCNVSAVPPTYPYSLTDPAQTGVEAFQSGGAEALEERWYWSSTQYAESSTTAWSQSFYGGSQYGSLKGWKGRVRAVRRFLIL